MEDSVGGGETDAERGEDVKVRTGEEGKWGQRVTAPLNRRAIVYLWFLKETDSVMQHHGVHGGFCRTIVPERLLGRMKEGL